MPIEWSNWASSDGIRIEDRALQKIIMMLLLLTPAIKVSRLSEGLIDSYKIVRTTSASAVLKRIEEEIVKVHFFESSSKLEQYLVESNPESSSDYSTFGELAYCTYTRPADAEKQIDNLKEVKQASVDSGYAKEESEIIKATFFRLDSFFRHLRNGIAHGCIRKFSQNNIAYYLIFDISKNKDKDTDSEFLSAIFILSEEKLIKLCNMLNSMKIKSKNVENAH